MAVCGHYCLFYLMLRCRGMSMSDITKHFTVNYNVNDEFEFINHRFSFCISMF